MMTFAKTAWREWRLLGCAMLLLAAACSSSGGGADDLGNDADGGAAVGDPQGLAGAAGAAADVGDADSGADAAVAADVEPAAECTDGVDADGDGLCDVDDPCPRDARVAVWFPGDPPPVVSAFVADLAMADNMTSVVALSDVGVPTADALGADYDAVVFGSNWGFGALDADAVGDLLADYVDAGGVVVESMFSHTSWTGMGTQEALGGRWSSEGYASMLAAAQIDAMVGSTTLSVDATDDPLVLGLDPSAFVADLNQTQPLYMTAGTIDADSPLGFVELAHWTYQDEDHPAILVSTDDDKRVLGLAVHPPMNFDSLNADAATRDFLACAISQLVRK